MIRRRWIRLAAAGTAAVVLGTGTPAFAQGAAPAPAAPAVPAGAVVRRIVMKDQATAEAFRQKLDTLKASGLFKDQLPGFDPKKPIPIEISFLTSGNYLLMIGSRDWVDANVEAIRLMGYLFDRPRALLQLNMRVVQLTGPANADVIQMTEAVSAFVSSQRDEVVRTFRDLDDYLTLRAKQRKGDQAKVLEAARELLPSLGTGSRPLTVPEILLLLMVDRCSPAPGNLAESSGAQVDAQEALIALPRALAVLLRDPHTGDAQAAAQITEELAAWKKAVTAARDFTGQLADALRQPKDGLSVNAVREALQRPDAPLPMWLSRRLIRSMELTERLYPQLLRRHSEEALRHMQQRFEAALAREEKIENSLAAGVAPPPDDRKKKSPPVRIDRSLIALKALADELVPSPMALFDAVASSADNSAPTQDQLIQLFRQYAEQRRVVETRLAADNPMGAADYQKLMSTESALNVWLRRVSEGMASALQQKFYNRYVQEIRLLANKKLSQDSNRDILDEFGIGDTPDIARDLLLDDHGVNIFVTNSVSLQFAQEQAGTVSATVQGKLPSQQSMVERLTQANQAASLFSSLSQQFGINGESVVKALLAGGQAVPANSGISLTATPSIGFDAGTVTLNIKAQETLNSPEKTQDHITNHSIDSATVSALTYEPMVLSTLTSNITYYEKSGGIPVLRKTPFVKDLLNDIPIPLLKEKGRQKGIYQSSVIILEPIVIPTIEDLIRFGGNDRPVAAAPGPTDATVQSILTTPAGDTEKPVVIQVPAAPK
jgi:hypothetical protein